MHVIETFEKYAIRCSQIHSRFDPSITVGYLKRVLVPESDYSMRD